MGGSAQGALLGTAFTYQGRLSDGGSPATGNYGLRFALYDAGTGGSLTGTPSIITLRQSVSRTGYSRWRSILAGSPLPEMGAGWKSASVPMVSLLPIPR